MIIPGANKQNLVKFGTDKWAELKQARKEKELIWMECVNAYLSQFDESWNMVANLGRSKRYVSLSFDAVETLQAILSSIIIGSGGDKYIGLVPGVPGNLMHDDESAKEMRAFLFMQAQRADFPRHLGVLIKQLAIVGNAPYTVSWRTEHAVNYPAYQAGMEKWQAKHKQAWQEYQLVMNQWKAVAKAAQAAGQEPPPRPNLIAPEPPPQKPDIAYANPNLEVGDIFNFVIDPFSADPKHALRIKRSWVPISTIRSMAQRNKNGYAIYENIENITERDRLGSNADDFLADRFRAFGLNLPNASQVELLELSGTMEIDGGHADQQKSTFVSFLMTIANDTTCIRFEPTYLWSGDSPTQLATYRDVPGQVYGIGALESALGLQNLVNARANQIVDVVNFVLNPEFKAVDDGVIERKPRSAPNKVHWVGHMDNFQTMDKNLSGVNISMQDLGELKREFQMMTKANAPVGSDPRQSATKTGIDANIIGQDIGKVADHIERTTVNKIFDLFIQLDAQYASENEMARFLQEGKVTFKKISPETIRRGWLFQSQGTKFFTDRVERSQNLMMFLNAVQVNPMTQALVNMPELLKRIAEDLGIEDMGSVFHDGERADEILGEMIRYGFFGNGGQQQQQLPAGSEEG